MTLREALTTAVDHIRSSSEDTELLAAARRLEAKAERMRARQEKPAMWPHRCICGERREEAMLVCWLCYREIPAALMLHWHLGRPLERRKALTRIELICRSRSAPVERRAA
jgi:hypothetical protein